MKEHEMRAIVQAQLALDLNCTVADLNGAQDALIFVPAAQREGRRPFPRGEHHFEMLTMGRAVVVSATPEILEIAQAMLMGKNRDEAFAMPFVYGHSLYHLPEAERLRRLEAPQGFDYALVERQDIPAFYGLEGFGNALSHDVRHPRPDVLATVARHGGRVVGMAGVSMDCERMWQIGIDILPECRGQGLAAYLVNWLTLEVLRQGKVPYYGTASCNIASQRVARRAGYVPAWVCAYRGVFEGFTLAPTS